MTFLRWSGLWNGGDGMRYKRFTKAVQVGGVCAAGLLYLLWAAGSLENLKRQPLSLLFSAAVLVLLAVFWRRMTAGESADGLCKSVGAARHAGSRSERYDALFTGAAFAAWNVLLLLAVYAIRRHDGYAGNFLEGLGFWKCADSIHYLDIARYGYVAAGQAQAVNLVFFPGFPLAVRLLQPLFHSYLYAGLAVSHLGFALGGAVLYRVLRLDYGRKTTFRMLAFFLLSPAGFFFAAPMSESFFLLWSALCVYLLRTGRRWLAGAAGGAAVFTRSMGTALAVLFVYEAAVSARRSSVKRAEKGKTFVKTACRLSCLPRAARRIWQLTSG